MERPLCRLFGASPRVKTMDVLLWKSPMELTVDGIAKHTDLSNIEIEGALSDLEESGLVEEDEGYFSCSDTEVVKKLRDLYIVEVQRANKEQ